MKPAAALRAPGTRRAALGLALLVLAADQVSKSVVVAAAPRGAPGGLVSVRLVRNTGASFGIGAGHPVLITLVAAAVLAVAIVLLVRTRSRGVALFLAAVTGGAAGNLADRLARSPGFGRGAVVDWIHVAGYPATFNLADVAIRLGAVGALIMAFASARREPARSLTRNRGQERTQWGPGGDDLPGHEGNERRRRESNPCTGLCRPLPKPLGHSAAGAASPAANLPQGRASERTTGFEPATLTLAR